MAGERASGGGFRALDHPGEVAPQAVDQDLALLLGRAFVQLLLALADLRHRGGEAVGDRAAAPADRARAGSRVTVSDRRVSMPFTALATTSSVASRPSVMRRSIASRRRPIAATASIRAASPEIVAGIEADGIAVAVTGAWAGTGCAGAGGERTGSATGPRAARGALVARSVMMPRAVAPTGLLGIGREIG